MLVLGIESTCDETGCAIVKDGCEILANVTSSQIDLHAEYGGVVPELACRRHVDVLIPVVDQALTQAGLKLADIDLFAVAHGPGLIGALLIGLNAAKSFALALNKPIIGVNHVEAHLYAAIMSQKEQIHFPCLGVVLSGGHTSLVKMHDVGRYELLGQTIDDAVGEAFDKVAKLLGLPYPGGPEIEALAREGNPLSFAFKAGNVKGSPLCFSFSGLKTSVLYTIKGQNAVHALSLSVNDQKNIAASFQHAAFTDIVQKTLLAAKQQYCNTLIFGGGVTNNQCLRHMFSAAAPELYCHWPSKGLSLDNAAMIAGLGFHRFIQNESKSHGFDLEAVTRMPF